MPKVYNRRRGSRQIIPAEAVYVGRPTQWGNPFVVGQDGGQSECVELYREWLRGPNGAVIAERARRELRGKDLVCWCAPKPCHADVLLEIANS